MVQGRYKGVRTPKPQHLASPAPGTTGPYLDALAQRLVFQPLQAREKQAILGFLGAQEATPIRDVTLAGRVQHVAALVLDSVYHALR